MAFAVASKAAPLAVAGLLKQLLRAAPSASASISRAAPTAAAALRPAWAVAPHRLLSTRGAPFRRDVFDSESEEGYSSGDEGEKYSSGDEDVGYDRLRSCSFSVSKFSSPDESMSLGRLLALMEDEAAAPKRGWWVSKEDADAVKLKVAMPGLGKEHVKVWADQDGGLMIEGKGDKDTEFDDDDEAPPRYSRRIEFSEDDFKMDQIKAEMKDGVLKVTVPKIKLEDRKDVLQVKVE